VTAILAIETSCDETAAAVVADGRDVRSNVVASQIDLHAKYGGVVPEIASRAHIEWLDGVVAEALDDAAIKPNDLDAIAVTNRPGLVGALLIGVTAAKTLAWAWNKPLVAVDHIQAHAYSAAMALEHDPFPAVVLVVSGGHTSLYHVRTPIEMERLGCTTDDAAGEAFDKVATILGLGYPGGPVIDRTAAKGDPRAIDFPRTMLGKDSLDFSFSGIKTAVLYHVNGPGKTSGGLEKLSDGEIADIAASFQAAVVDVLVRKTLMAVRRTGVRTVLAGGGVAANSHLRDRLGAGCAEAGAAVHLAPFALCTDNAAMIGGLAYHRLTNGHTVELDLPAMAQGTHG
jgi:N6-L-threonylcarbamoyladenine synthase